MPTDPEIVTLPPRFVPLVALAMPQCSRLYSTIITFLFGFAYTWLFYEYDTIFWSSYSKILTIALNTFIWIIPVVI